MARNRVLGGGLHIEAKTESFTTWWQTDQYQVSAVLGTPVTVTISPEIQDGDQVVIADAGNNANAQPITILAPEGKPFLGGATSAKINQSGGSLQLTYSLKSSAIGVVDVGPSAPLRLRRQPSALASTHSVDRSANTRSERSSKSRRRTPSPPRKRRVSATQRSASSLRCGTSEEISPTATQSCGWPLRS